MGSEKMAAQIGWKIISPTFVLRMTLSQETLDVVKIESEKFALLTDVTGEKKQKQQSSPKVITYHRSQ